MNILYNFRIYVSSTMELLHKHVEANEKAESPFSFVLLLVFKIMLYTKSKI